MTFKLKICGMKYPKNITEVGKLLPDYMGFIFYEKSPRFFDDELPNLPESIQKVGVFVNATLEAISEKIKKYDLNLVQLHGNELANFCERLKEKKIKIIKVFSVDDDFSFDQIIPFEDVCDYFLFDTKGKNYGGNGIIFNWEILKNYPSKKPFFLSGGIGVAEISKIKQLNLPLFAIDVNSKFEIKPGQKNSQLLKELQDELSR